MFCTKSELNVPENLPSNQSYENLSLQPDSDDQSQPQNPNRSFSAAIFSGIFALLGYYVGCAYPIPTYSFIFFLFVFLFGLKKIRNHNNFGLGIALCVISIMTETAIIAVWLAHHQVT